MAGESNQKWVCQLLTLDVLCNLCCCTSNMWAQKRHGDSRYMTFVEVLIFHKLPTDSLSLFKELCFLFGIKDYQRGENLCKSEIWRFSLCGTPLPPSSKTYHTPQDPNPSLCVIGQEAKEMKGSGL